MSKNQETLIRRFWRRVFDQPGKPCVLVKNTGPAEEPVIIGGGGMGMPMVYTPPYRPYRELSNNDVGILVAEIMTFLRQVCFRKGDRAAILSWNSPEWVWTDLAIQSMGGVTVPIYPNNNPDAVNFILGNCGASVIFADSSEQLAKVDGRTSVKKFLFREAIENLADYGHTPPSQREISILTRNQLKEIEDVIRQPELRPILSQDFAEITRKDLATIIYTSGSTGNPKGVPLTHGNIASALETLSASAFEFREDDVALSYLPLAHVYERVDGTMLTLWNGVPSVYCSPEEMPNIIRQVSPSVLIGVPAVWRKMKTKIDDQLNSKTGIARSIINWALKQNQPGFKRWLADKLVYRKVREGLGGRLRIIMSGGAAISPDILNFFNLVSLPLLEGYGMTETSGGIIVNTPTSNKVGTVGKVIPGVVIKVVPREQDTEPNTGVLWVKNAGEDGPIFGGYHNLPEENAKSFDAEGFFCTGDVVHVDEDGFVAIRGRAKRQGKTEHGKYVSPDDVEKAFDGQAVVAYLVPIFDGRPFVSALIFVNQAIARELLVKSGVTVPSGDAAAFIASQPIVVKAVEEAVAEANKKLQKWETVKKYVIMPVEATINNGLLTPTLKMRSEEAMKRYKSEIEKIYAK